MKGCNDSPADQVTYQRPSCIFNKPGTKEQPKIVLPEEFDVVLVFCRKIILNMIIITFGSEGKIHFL